MEVLFKDKLSSTGEYLLSLQEVLGLAYIHRVNFTRKGQAKDKEYCLTDKGLIIVGDDATEEVNMFSMEATNIKYRLTQDVSINKVDTIVHDFGAHLLYSFIGFKITHMFKCGNMLKQVWSQCIGDIKDYEDDFLTACIHTYLYGSRFAVMSSKGVANHRMNFQQPTSLEVLTLLYKELVNEAEVKMSSGNHKIKYSECEHSFTDSTGKPLSSKFIEMYIADSNPLVDGDKIDRNLYILI